MMSKRKKKKANLVLIVLSVILILVLTAGIIKDGGIKSLNLSGGWDSLFNSISNEKTKKK